MYILTTLTASNDHIWCATSHLFYVQPPQFNANDGHQKIIETSPANTPKLLVFAFGHKRYVCLRDNIFISAVYKFRTNDYICPKHKHNVALITTLIWATRIQQTHNNNHFYKRHQQLFITQVISGLYKEIVVENLVAKFPAFWEIIYIRG